MVRRAAEGLHRDIVSTIRGRRPRRIPHVDSRAHEQGYYRDNVTRRQYNERRKPFKVFYLPSNKFLYSQLAAIHDQCRTCNKAGVV